MPYFHVCKGSSPRKVVSMGIAILSLVFIISGSFSVLAQEEGTSEPAGETVEVSAEAQAAAESELVVSAEAQKELDIDLHAELGHEGYDGLVPSDGFLGTIAYPLKEVAWDLQEGVYDVFASDSSHAQLVVDHADLHLLDATEQFAEDPESAGTVLGILDAYKDNLAEVKASMEGLKEENPELAKSLSAEIAENHLFTTSKVFGTMQDAISTSDPEAATELVSIKSQVFASAGGTIVSASDSQTEVTETLNIIANQKQQTAFSGISNAEILSQVKDSLGDAVSSEIHGAFDQVIGVQLKTMEENIKNLAASDEVKADQFQNYMAQLPGSSLARMKMVDTFKSTTGLPPIFIEKCNEIKAKVAEAISKKIETAVNQIVDEKVRQAFNQAMMHSATSGVDDIRILNEFHDLVPSEQIRQEIAKNRDSQVEKFLGRFGSDANAAAVTNEFKVLTDKVANGQILPDPKFFQTLEGLKNRLNPEQQKFITDMENTGKQEMVNRMQNDTHFAERLSSFNPADMQVFEKFSKEGFGPQFGPPPGFNFDAKFAQIEARQAQNFEKFLGFQNNPESVKQIQQQFENFVPQEIRERFQTRYDFNPEAFRKHETFAGEKHDFFQQKFEEIQKQFPGGPGFPFPGAAPFGAPGFPGFTPPPFFQQGGQQGQPGQPGEGESPVFDYQYIAPCPSGTTRTAYGCEIPYEKPQYDPSASCAASGGSWTGSYCKFETNYQTPAYQTPTGNYPTPYGTDGKYLTPPPYLTPFHDYQTPTYPTPGQIYPSPYGHDGSYQTPPAGYPTPTGEYPTPTYPSPSASYPTPPAGYPTPTAGYPTPTGTTYPTPYDYHPPGYAYPTPTTYPSPTGTYPTPSYVTPPEGYPTPTTYPTPSTTTYPTPAYAYPTPTETYPTPSTTTYPTPSYAYPTPHTESYPTPAYAYPTPAYAYPTPTESYPTPAYATPAYAYPTPEYHTPYATPAAYKGPGQVAGARTVEVHEGSIGIFDFLAVFGLGWYGYRRKKVQGMA